VWLAEYGADRIGQLNPQTGEIAEIPLAPGSHPWGITAGLNGDLWFTEYGRNQIGRINVNTSQVDEYPINSRYTTNSQPIGIVADFGGRIWSAESNGRSFWIINPDLSHCEISLFDAMIYFNPRELTLGLDGRLWFTGYARSGASLGSFVGWISGDCHGSSAHWTTRYLPNPGYQGITEGPDGTIWVVEENANAIGHFDGDGSLLDTIPIPTPNSHPREITTAPDGSLWFTEYGASQIGQVTVGDKGSVTITEQMTPTPDSGPFGITPGQDGNIWFTENRANQIGQVVLVGPMVASLSLTTASAERLSGSPAECAPLLPTAGLEASWPQDSRPMGQDLASSGAGVNRAALVPDSLAPALDGMLGVDLAL
jgi:virginiamycin B lyase